MRGAALLMLLAGCTAPFASHQADLFRFPPPLLPADAHAFWNDVSTRSYGEFSVGAAQYRRAGAVCRTARITSIDDAARRWEDRSVLYCAGADGRMALDPATSCRASRSGAGVACRDAAGDNVLLEPM